MTGRVIQLLASWALLIVCSSWDSVADAAFSPLMKMSAAIGGNRKSDIGVGTSPRRTFLVKSFASITSAAAISAGVLPGMSSASAAEATKKPQIFTTEKGVKYAITKDAKSGKEVVPLPGDIVAIEYTGYLTSGQIFDSTHSEGKSNSLLFKLGSGSVIPGLDDVVAKMAVGMKVQAIIPPSLAYGEKGVCLEDKPTECLIRPGETLVYDIYLKKSSIPPP